MLKAPKGFIAEDDPRVAQIGHPAPPWLVNYADLMTEMVAFFVILYALGAALNKDVVESKQAIQEVMKNEEVAGKVEVRKDGLRITMEDSKALDAMPFFESGQAVLTPRLESILDKIAPTLIDLANKNFDILVEGHTDNIPIRSAQFHSNWELSTARATVVLKYLVEHRQMPPSKIGAVGYGEFRPVASNDTEDGRRQNRRVVFFAKVPSKPLAEESSQEDSSQEAKP